MSLIDISATSLAFIKTTDIKPPEDWIYNVATFEIHLSEKFMK